MRAGEIGHASIAPGEMRQDTPPGGIGQSRKRSIQSAGIFNHSVNYCQVIFDAQALFLSRSMEPG